MQDRVTNTYEHALQAAYYEIGNRGIHVNVKRVQEAKAIRSRESNLHASCDYGSASSVEKKEKPECQKLA